MAHRCGACDLALGAPDFEPPEEVRKAVAEAFLRASHQYTRTAGLPELCQGIAEKARRQLGIDVDHDTEITVTCGVTEATSAVLMGLGRPGDEAIVFDPYFVNYLPSLLAGGMTPRFVRLRGPEWELDPAELASAFTSKTRLVLLNTPNNPTGKVFTRDELEAVAELCERWNAFCVTDEIYESLVFDGRQHVSMLSLPTMRERAIVMSGFSKTYSVTGWRIGYVIAAPRATEQIRKVHEFLTCCAPGPLQAAAAIALRLPETYYERLRSQIQSRRDHLVAALKAGGLECHRSDGGYFLMADIRRLGFARDYDFVRFLIQDVGVAAVPGSAFFAVPSAGAHLVRFCFGKSEQTIEQAVSRLGRLRATH
jgi:aminotransferase